MTDPAPSSSPALVVRDLSVHYPGGSAGVTGVSFTVAAGEVVALVGRSGSGKSTVLRTLLGLLPRGSRVTGEVMVDGRRLIGPDGMVGERTLRRHWRGRRIGYVAQDPYGSVDPILTVGRHIVEAWRAIGARPPSGALIERLHALGLASPQRWLHRRPGVWSGGMLQRADLVAGTAHHPPLLLADEPTSALDAELADAALAALVGAARTVVLTSHDLELVERHADRVMVLEAGRLVSVSAPAPTPESASAPVHQPPPEAASVAAIRRAPGSDVVRLVDADLGYSGSPPVLRGVDLTVRAGEIVGLVGRSGSGKTTVLRAISGRIRPLSGRIEYGTPRRPGFVMPVFAESAASLDPRWPIWRTVAEALAATGGGRIGAYRGRAIELLAELDMAEVDPDARPGRLSGGQRQRVAVARALAGDPALVVADEPTAQLDGESAAGVLGALERLAERGVALVVASHDTRALARFADRITSVRDGGGRVEEGRS